MNARAVRIAPSILTADFGRLADQIAAAEDGGADFFHLDVMDGRFVPQLSFGPLVVEAVRRATSIPLEAHMMVVEPLAQLEPLAEAGAQRLVFHIEAAPEPSREIARARELGCEVGLAVSPETPSAAVLPWIEQVDEVVVMLVNPGRGGQQPMPEHLAKARELRAAAGERGLDLAIEIDGGVKTHNAAECVAAGADVLVAGSAVYNDRETPQQALAALRAALAAATAPR